MLSSLGAAALPMCLPMRSGMPARRFHVAVVHHQVAAAAVVGREGKESPEVLALLLAVGAELLVGREERPEVEVLALLAVGAELLVDRPEVEVLALVDLAVLLLLAVGAELLLDLAVGAELLVDEGQRLWASIQASTPCMRAARASAGNCQDVVFYSYDGDDDGDGHGDYDGDGWC